ncbi:hypothetical protein [Rhodalgimonas zhirmunskyi]|uniref:Uncharacterized protein n=1 Tax=Rhodalgimonas zhirmunskyi TaxID=2964767 RepID=A0AAJ1X6S6_9RHOB|nr:hypothetical protein [Rhodoalgimonas zhirmunskyi]MDQ2095796.1 hypothetical protein [Rhodoalgimonas zhirmunskyi]
MQDETRDRWMPLAVAGGLALAGVALYRAKPEVLALPEPEVLDEDEQNHLSRAARRTRDGVARFAPSNIAESLGRSMVIAGVALALTRVLDEVAAKRR